MACIKEPAEQSETSSDVCPSVNRLSLAKSQKEIHVGIIGAGFAGLRCADVLLRHGIRVTILEARDRLGGRVAQSDDLGRLVDLGPNWIHGTDDNPIMTLAQETNTPLHTWIEEPTVFDSQGRLLPKDEADELNELLWDLGLIKEAFEYSNAHYETIDPRMSLYDFFVEKVHDMFVSCASWRNSFEVAFLQWKAFSEALYNPPFAALPDHMIEGKPVAQAQPISIRKRNLPNNTPVMCLAEDLPAETLIGTLGPEQAQRKRHLLLQLADMWGCYIGSPITRQSLKYFWLEECIEGENPFVAGTYQNILERVAKPATEKAEILKNHEVVGIKARNSPSGRGPSITTSTDTVLSFDEVVVTTPLGWLKRNKDKFDPALPARLSTGIDNISYGQLDKVYITFAEAFWDFDNPVTRDVPTVKEISSAVAEEKPRSTFMHWLAPNYVDSTQQQWYQECMNMAALPTDTGHPTLLFYIQGPQSDHIARIVVQSETEQEREARLIEFFTPYFSRLPNYRETDPACIPKAILATAWANDKFAGYGSYANFQIGLEKGDEDIQVMRRGMPERCVWLAGEHTAPFIALGTTTGAYLSGEAVGTRIVNAYGL